jgi:uncharacterized protein (DUF362 family)
MVEVLLVKDNNRVKGLQSVFTHYSTLFQSLRDKKVVIKPNFNTADPPPASTDIRVIKTLITYLKESKAKRITVAERAGPADTEETMKVKGLFDLHDELGGFDILDLSFLPDSKWVKYQANGLHWKNGFLYPKIYQEADVIIALPCLKTHRYGGHFTLSLKLAVGLVPRAGYNYMKELHSSPYQRTLITEINLVYSPTLIILDGVDAFTDGGPEKGTLVHPHVMLASTDRIAIDAVGVAILRDFGTTPEVSKGSIFDQEQIARAVELNLGVKNPSDISLITTDESSQHYAEKIKEILLA